MSAISLILAQKELEIAAREAGKLLLGQFGRAKIAVQKGDHDFATAADLASEKLILRRLKKLAPDVAVLAEESGGELGPGDTWVIDPLDGTKNFFAGVPLWCVSLALVRAGQPVVGVIFCPLTGELYSARAGGGARLNGRKITVSPKNKLRDALALAEGPRHAAPTFAVDLARFNAALQNLWRVRMLGSSAYALALVARGAADGFLDFALHTKIWDTAAGEVLVREAGGCVRDITPAGAPPFARSVLATNSALFTHFQKLLGRK